MKKNSLARQMRQHTGEQRNKIAERVLDEKAVYAAMKEAATAGQLNVRIIQIEPVDLSGTHYAEGLTKQLEKDGFKYHWQDAVRKEFHHDPETGKQIETGHMFRFKELFISWGEGVVVHSPREEIFQPDQCQS